MSSFDLPGIQRVRFAVESTFGSDLTSDVATNFFDMRHEMIRPKMEPLVAPDTTVVQRAFQQRNDVLGPHRMSAQCSFLWTGTNQALDDATAATETSQSKLMAALLGGYTAAQGSTVAASPAPSTTGCSVATGEGSRFSEGTVIGVTVGTTVYPVYVTRVSTDALTWWPALPSAPASSADVYNSQSIYLTEQPGNQIQMLAEAAKQRGNIWLGLGGQGDFTLDLTRGSLAKWGTTLQFADYQHDDEFATPQGGSPIAVATYDGTGPIHVMKGGLHFGPTASTTRAMMNASAVSITFGRKWLEQGLPSGVNGLDEWELDTRDRRMVEITIRKSDAWEDYHDAYEAETDYGMLWWVGASAGQIRSVCAPTMQIAKPPEQVEAFGVEGLKITLLVKESTLCSDQTTELRRSPFVLGHV